MLKRTCCTVAIKLNFYEVPGNRFYIGNSKTEEDEPEQEPTVFTDENAEWLKPARKRELSLSDEDEDDSQALVVS